jgi:hypothetical protein
MIYTNLVPNPSFTNGTTDWVAAGTGTTLTALLDGGYSNTFCVQVNKTAGNSGTGLTTNVTSMSVVVGSSYTASAYIKVPTGAESGSFSVSISFFTSGNSLIGSAYASTPAAITSADGWVRLQRTQIAPATSAYAKVSVLQTTSTTSNDIYHVDAVQFENSTIATQFVDSFEQTLETSITNQGLRSLLPGDIVTKPYVTGLKLLADISINGLVLNTVDQDDVVWVCTDIEGWWNLPEPEIPDIPRGLDDGSYDVRGRWKARDLVLKGSILPPTPAYGVIARQTLIEALALVYTGGWLLVDDGTVKSAYVRLYGKPTIENVNARGRIDFTLPLRSVDPLKYSWNPNDADGITTTNLTPVAIGNTTSTSVTNAGNTNVTAVFSITGPMTAPAYIRNVTSNQSIKIIKSLRDNTYSATATTRSRTSKVSTITTSSNHGFLVGDVVTVANVAPSTFSGTFTISSVTDNTFSYVDAGTSITSATLTSNVVSVVAPSHGFSLSDSVYISNLGYPYDGTYLVSNVTSSSAFQYLRTAPDTPAAYDGNASLDVVSGADPGTVVLSNSDTLQIDTYNTTVLYRGLPDSARSTVDVDIDWIKLQPGVNNIRVEKTDGTPASATIKYRSGWIG